ncbi:MAG: hypothetical protein ABIL58_16500 [Pseudomonadota bacterium]
MPKRIKADPAQLIKMVKDAVDQKEIMAHFGFKTSTQLTVAYTNALMETGAIPAIKTGRGGKKAEKEISKEVVVGKRGSIIIPAALVEEHGFVEGNRFFVKKSKAGLTLSRKYK